MCQNLSFPTVVGSEIQALFFTPFLDALSAGPAFEDPLFPDGRLLDVLNVVDCHFDPLQLHEVSDGRSKSEAEKLIEKAFGPNEPCDYKVIDLTRQVEIRSKMNEKPVAFAS